MNGTEDREIIISRILNAPRELVFDVWTSPEHVDKWWGPNGFRNVTSRMEVRNGGEWVYVMHGPDGTIYNNRIRFLEVQKPEKLSYLHDSGIEDDPAGFQVQVTFEAVGKQTRLTMRSLFKTKEARDFVVREFGAIDGGHQHLAKLEEYLRRME